MLSHHWPHGLEVIWNGSKMLTLSLVFSKSNIIHTHTTRLFFFFFFYFHSFDTIFFFFHKYKNVLLSWLFYSCQMNVNICHRTVPLFFLNAMSRSHVPSFIFISISWILLNPHRSLTWSMYDWVDSRNYLT